MKFFNNHTDNQSNWITLNIPKGHWYGNGLKNENYDLVCEKDYNRALDGDEIQVNEEGKVINVKRKEGGHKIVGVLKLFGKHKLSPNSKGIPTYNFHPRDKRYPFFTVCSSILKSQNPPPRQDIFCVIDFFEWNDDMKIPRGVVNQVIGEVGDEKNNFMMNLWNRGLYRKTPVLPNDYELLDNNSSVRHDFTDKIVFSIDPPGCIDIDDAFHITKLENNIYEIGIHISDVSSFIPPHSKLDLIAQQNSTTIYLPHEKRNMIPSQLADDALSLHQGKPRSAFTTLLYVKDDGEIKNYDFIHTLILNKKAYTYDDANEDLNKNENSINSVITSLQKLFSLYQKMEKHFNFNSFSKENPIKDTHDLVEYFMVLTNHLVCKYLDDHQLNHPATFINRIHSTPDISKLPDTKENNSVKLENFLYRRCMSAAEYSTKKGNHYGLSITQYLHFTSPIRRYADILAHRFLDQIIQNKKLSSSEINSQAQNTNLICQHMNQIAKKIKQLERDNQKVIISHDLPKEGKEYLGYIIGIGEDEEGNMKVEIYIPELDFSKDICLWKKNMAHCIHLSQLSENQYEFYHAEEKLSLQIYQEIKIKIIPSTQSASIGRKMRIMWIEPNLSAFLIA